ncbi:unnamed protein product [Ranitomeya imitator]|uniref:Uncharacterized protein n=1 Tax=Ranitomeya imitator TaxID=111125 RepID=A0ABN9L4G6_9NEOB|nr:unnamed protein product [Ranitomeya imitator]
MKDQKEERNKWPMGLISKTFPSDDGKVEVSLHALLVNTPNSRLMVAPVSAIATCMPGRIVEEGMAAMRKWQTLFGKQTYSPSARHYRVPRVSVSLSCTPSVSVIILYPECQRHYPVPQVSVPLSCTPSVSVIILYPECQCHYPVPRVSVSLSCTPTSLSCTPSVSVIILYPECQCHYPVPRVSVSLSCTPSVSVIILYPECQRHYPVPRVSVSLSCTPSVSVIILYPECQCHYLVPQLKCPGFSQEFSARNPERVHIALVEKKAKCSYCSKTEYPFNKSLLCNDQMY